MCEAAAVGKHLCMLCINKCLYLVNVCCPGLQPCDLRLLSSVALQRSRVELLQFVTQNSLCFTHVIAKLFIAKTECGANLQQRSKSTLLVLLRSGKARYNFRQLGKRHPSLCLHSNQHALGPAPYMSAQCFASLHQLSGTCMSVFAVPLTYHKIYLAY